MILIIYNLDHFQVKLLRCQKVTGQSSREAWLLKEIEKSAILIAKFSLLYWRSLSFNWKINCMQPARHL